MILRSVSDSRAACMIIFFSTSDDNFLVDRKLGENYQCCCLAELRFDQTVSVRSSHNKYKLGFWIRSLERSYRMETSSQPGVLAARSVTIATVFSP